MELPTERTVMHTRTEVNGYTALMTFQHMSGWSSIDSQKSRNSYIQSFRECERGGVKCFKSQLITDVNAEKPVDRAISLLIPGFRCKPTSEMAPSTVTWRVATTSAPRGPVSRWTCR